MCQAVSLTCAPEKSNVWTDPEIPKDVAAELAARFAREEQEVSELNQTWYALGERYPAL